MMRSFTTATLLVAVIFLIPSGADGAAPAATSTNEPAKPTGTATSLGLEAFQLVYERNIFNPNRSGRTPEREVTKREPERRVRTDAISLVGTIAYDKGDFAFFDGSSSSYRRAVQATETIADLTITAISATQVVLRTASTNGASETNAALTFTLPVGMQLRRHDDGPWEVAARSDSSASSSSSSSSAPAAGSDDVLKRLMQQREKEGGAAAPAAEPAPAPTAAAGPAPTDSNSTPSPSPGPGGAENEVLKRLMQRREKGE